jgi:ribose transport system substrate-binding protein
MGYKVMQAFQQMAEGGEPPADPTFTGLDICTPATVDTCIAQ